MQILVQYFNCVITYADTWTNLSFYNETRQQQEETLGLSFFRIKKSKQQVEEKHVYQTVNFVYILMNNLNCHMFGFL